MRRRSPLISNLAWILDREGHNAEAKKLDREELDIQRRVLWTGAPGYAQIDEQSGEYASPRKP